MLTDVCRCKSQKALPLLTVRLSIEADRDNINGTFWVLAARLAPGLLMGRTWTTDFVDYALTFQPAPCKKSMLTGVAGATPNRNGDPSQFHTRDDSEQRVNDP